MNWRVEFDASALKDLRKIDRTWRDRILSYLDKVGTLNEPRSRGRALSGDLAGLWRYRVGDYRVICEIRDDTLVIRAIKISHRRDVYDLN